MLCVSCHFRPLKRCHYGQYNLVLSTLQRHVRQTMQYVVLLTRVDMHLGQSEDVYS